MKTEINQVIEEIKAKIALITSNSPENRRAKGAYTDCIMILKAKITEDKVKNNRS